jgi:hypothetical protein
MACGLVELIKEVAFIVKTPGKSVSGDHFLRPEE